MSDELWRRSATELAPRIRRRELSARRGHAGAPGPHRGGQPACSTRSSPSTPSAALRAAAAADRRARRAASRPGRCTACRSRSRTSRTPPGMRTTYGSPIYRDHVPDAPTRCSSRGCAEPGAIVIGKTNTPEFGAGSQTFNAVFGATRNPYDRARTPGGSSGGAAAAVASGMLPLADGSDLGGERPQPGLVLQRRRAAPVARPRSRRCRRRRVEPAARPRADRADRRRTPRCCCGRWPAPTRVRRCRSTIRPTPSPTRRRRPRAAVRIAWSERPRRPARRAGGDRRAASAAAARSRRSGCIVEDAEPDLTRGRRGLRGPARRRLRAGLR